MVKIKTQMVPVFPPPQLNCDTGETLMGEENPSLIFFSGMKQPSTLSFSSAEQVSAG